MLKRIQLVFLFLISLFFASIVWAKIPYFPIQFPRDEAAHYDNVPYTVNNMTEWWYYNGRFTTKDGRKFGYYLNYMYIQLALGGKKVMIPLFMMQVTDLNNQKVYGKTIFSTPFESHFSTQNVDLAYGKDVTLKKDKNTFLLNGALKSEADQPSLKFSLETTPIRDVLLVNKTGFIEMFNNTNSYYYSYTRLNTTGYIQIGDEKFEIDPTQSLMWMDHQWGDFIISPGDDQWFFSLIQLDNGMDILTTLPYDRAKKEYRGDLGFASIVMPDNSRIYIKNQKLFAREIQGEKHPQYYELSIPEINLQLTLTSLAPNQDLNWISESASSIEGFFNGGAVKGSGNIESTVEY